MKDDAKFTNDIKEYTSKYRAVKTEYEPDRYYHNEDATENFTINYKLKKGIQ